MVVVDRFTKVSHFIPTFKTITGAETAKLFLSHVVRLHGFPQEIVSDRDTRFQAKFWDTIHTILGTQLLKSSANHPESDGQTERTIRTVTSLIRSFAANDPQNWVELLPMLEFAYNSSFHATIKTTPFMADIGRNPQMPPLQPSFHLENESTLAKDLSVKLRAIQLRTAQFLTDGQHNQERWANKTREDITYEVGDWILLHRDAYSPPTSTLLYRKVQPVYHGPFRLVQKINDQAFEVDIPLMSKAHRTINIQWFKRFHERLERYPKQPPRLSLEAIDRAKLGEITEIAGFDTEAKTYDVFWSDCRPGHASTISEEILMNYVPQAQREYLIQQCEPLRHYVLRKDEEQTETAEVPTSKETNDSSSLQSISSDSLTTNSSSADEIDPRTEIKGRLPSLKRHTKNRVDSNQTGENVSKRKRIYNTESANV